MQKNPKISIIFVRYKARHELLKSIDSIVRSKPISSYEIIVVDNNERKSFKKETLKKFPKVIYIKSKNKGYGAGNNLGASVAKGNYLLVLNPDTKVLKGTIDALVNYLDKSKKTAVVAPNLLTKSNKLFKKMGSKRLTPLRGIFTLSFINKLFPNNKYSRRYYLTDVDQKKLREVDSVPGSAFMIRKKVFEKIGMYDEKIFMFFEEEDLGKRIKDLGYKIVINPKAKIVHYWVSSKKSKKLTNIYNQSRFYYFKKHYGVVAASVVEMFARFSKWHLAVILITLLGAFLRFYGLEENLDFNAELGHNYLAIKNFINNRQIPLLGPPTSHPWLSFGPLFYWIMAPILVLGNYNPLAGAYFMGIISTSLIIINFFVIKKIFNQKIATISSYLISISPAFLTLSLESRFFSLVVVFFYPFLYFFIKSIKENGKYLFWVGLFLGLMLNFHLTPILLIPALAMLIYLKRKRFDQKNITMLIIGILIPNLPFIFFNVSKDFEMIIKLVLWIPYRIGGFIGLIPKNTANTYIISSNFKSFYSFIEKSFLVNNTFLGFLLFVTLSVYIISRTFKLISKRQTSINWLVILSILYWAFIGIFLHGDPPSHYYLPIYPIPIILFSVLLNKLWKKNYKYFLVIVLLLLSFINFKYYFSNKWYYKSSWYTTQKKIVETILTDAAGKSYELGRVGGLDQYEGDFAQDYQYLLWWTGNEPVSIGDIVVDIEKKPQIKYTIYEDISKLPKDKNIEIYWVENIAIVKRDIN